MSQERRLTSAGANAYTRGLDGIHITDICARFSLPVSDRGGSIAEREGGGLGWGIRRNGLADGVRPARIGDTTFEGDDGLGDSVHGYLALTFDSGDATGWGYRRKYDFGQASGANLDQTACEHNDTAAGNGSGRSDIGDPRDRTGETGTAIGNAKQSQDRRVADVAFELAVTATERSTDPTASAAEEVEQETQVFRASGDGGIGRRTSLRC